MEQQERQSVGQEFIAWARKKYEIAQALEKEDYDADLALEEMSIKIDSLISDRISKLTVTDKTIN